MSFHLKSSFTIYSSNERNNKFYSWLEYKKRVFFNLSVSERSTSIFTFILSSLIIHNQKVTNALDIQNSLPEHRKNMFFYGSIFLYTLYSLAVIPFFLFFFSECFLLISKNQPKRYFFYEAFSNNPNIELVEPFFFHYIVC